MSGHTETLKEWTNEAVLGREVTEQLLTASSTPRLDKHYGTSLVLGMSVDWIGCLAPSHLSLHVSACHHIARGEVDLSEEREDGGRVQRGEERY